MHISDANQQHESSTSRAQQGKNLTIQTVSRKQQNNQARHRDNSAKLFQVAERKSQIILKSTVNSSAAGNYGYNRHESGRDSLVHNSVKMFDDFMVIGLDPDKFRDD